MSVARRLYSDKSRQNALAFRPRPSDVVTITTPKVGQTWLMATLRKISLGKSVGSEDPRLSTTVKSSDDAIPWLEQIRFIGKLGNDQPGKCALLTGGLTASPLCLRKHTRQSTVYTMSMQHPIITTQTHPQPSVSGRFRVFKSHLQCAEIRDCFLKKFKKTKFITVFRDPCDVALSWHRHMRGGSSLPLCQKHGCSVHICLNLSTLFVLTFSVFGSGSFPEGSAGRAGYDAGFSADDMAR